MSNQFYNYLSNKLFQYFNGNHIVKGDKFYVHFDEAEQVEEFYNSLKTLGRSTLCYSPFKYVNEYSGKEYNSFYLDLNGIKLVVASSLNVTVDYLVTLRNQVTSQKGVWEDTALLVVCHDSIDSIQNGMRDLQKEGMPFSVKSISDNLESEIDSSKKLSKSDKEIAKFSLLNKEDDLFETTLWDYETILSIIDKGVIDSEELYDLGLFKDNNLDNFTVPQMRRRLKENFDTFEEIRKYSQYSDVKEQLKKSFSDSGVTALSKEDWYTKDWKFVKKSKDDYIASRNPLNYIENDEKITNNGLVYWERPQGNTKAARRKRNIIVFNPENLSNFSLDFSFDQTLRKDFINQRSRNIASTSGKKLKLEFELSRSEPTFKTVSYKHNNESSSNFTFNIAVLNSTPEPFDSIKSRYTIDVKNKAITVVNDEDSDDIVLGTGENEVVKEIEDKNEKLYLYNENDHILISEKSPAWEDGSLSFNLNHNNNDVGFIIKEKSKRSVPVKSSTIWSFKRQNKENFAFNGVKAVQDVNSFYLEDKFKEFLILEREIIRNDIFYGKIEVDGSLTKMDVSFSDELESAYLAILNYYKTFDDTPEDNLPSLVYINDTLKGLYENFIEVFNNEISEIEENDILSDFETKKDLAKLGRIDKNNKIMYSSLSPINIAYQLEILKQCGNERLDSNMLERFVPNNLVPYLCSDDGKELYRPIYQEDAHEWLVYEKSEEVSIGTTNVFISKVVSEKLNQFVKHFEYLFNINPKSPIKINLINIGDDKEVVKGVFEFIRARLPDKVKTKHIVPIEINIYNDSDKSSFDTLFDCNSKEQLLSEFGIKIKSDLLDEMDVLRSVQNNIEYYKHKNTGNSYDYAHISFYKVKSHNNIANDNMDKIETGLSLNGLLSSVTSTTKHSEYRTGFGTKNILNFDNDLVKTAINVNELVENSKNYGKNTYSKNKSIITTIELEEDNIEELYDKSHWVTFIEPTFGIEYFDDSNNLIIIHYSDQYSSSSKYDTITVTNKSAQYEEIIKDFLLSKNVETTPESVESIIKMFNSINGEWLLRLISNPGEYDREKLSIVSAIKYCLAILDHENIVWIPVSMEEILRIAGTVRLDKSKGIFASNMSKGAHSDDLLFIGLKFNDNSSIEVIFYPIEVKIGINLSGTIKKGKTQLINTYNLLKDQLKKINNEGYAFKNKFFRNFFIQILLSNEQKLMINQIWDEKGLDKIENFKDKLLNDDFEVSYVLEEFIGKGSLMSFKKDCHHLSIKMDVDKQIIELPEEYAYSGLIKSINEIYEEIQSDETDIVAERLLSHVSNLSSMKTVYPIENEGTDDFEYSDDDIEVIFGDESDDLSSSDDEEIFAAGGDTEDTEEEVTVYKDYEPPKIEGVSDIRALIGTQNGYNHKIFWEFGNPALGNRHMLIQGKSGQGKTYFIQRMLKELSTQGVPSIIIDYTDGFKKSKLESEFKDALGDKLTQYMVFVDKFPLNPFKKNRIELDEDVFVPEDNISVASRFKSTVNAVYNLGDQQLNTIYQAVLKGLDKYDENMDLTILKEELINDDSATAGSALNKLNELLDKNPFESSEFDWSILNNSDGKVIIIQLTGLSKDIQKIVSEFILWDLWNYKASSGSEDNPFVVVLDEAHNLDFGANSPCSKILTEGRKFGWSGWFATQSVKGLMKTDEITRLENAEEKIYFHPTDNSVSSIANTFSKDVNERKNWETKLSRLNKGQCIVYGSIMNSNGDVVPSDPLIVNIDPIVNDVVKSEDDHLDNNSPRR